MAIFPNLKLESIVQTDDKTRLDGTKSFISKDEAAITLIEIEPEAGAGYIEVTASSSRDWYLDWVYSGVSRTVTASIRITTDGGPVIYSKDIEVLTPEADKLFSDDTDLVNLEGDILGYVRAGRNSFLDFHRKSQFLILDHFNDLANYDSSGDRLTKDAIVDVLEVMKWSMYWTLELIFEDISNDVDDKFEAKRAYYAGKRVSAMDKAVVKLDDDGDGTIEAGEGISIKTTRMVVS